MKVAEVRYTGDMRSRVFKTVSATNYTLRRYPGNPDREELEWFQLDDPEDARWFEDQDQVEVRWTPIGKLRATTGDAVDAMREMGYTAKQKLVGDDGFNLDVAGNAGEDELEDALADHINQLEEGGEL